MRVPRVPDWLRRRRYAVAGVALLAAAGVLATVLLAGPDVEATGQRHEPDAAPTEYIDVFLSAAASCPALSPSRLAGQVMTESQFKADATTSRSGFGLAGLTDDEWNIWQPWDNADRMDPATNILALAHLMCDLVGRTRATPIEGDPWQLALAAFHVGFDPVRQAGGVPESAKQYVSDVIGNSAWFGLTPGFDGSPVPTLTPSSPSTPPTTPPATAGPTTAPPTTIAPPTTRPVPPAPTTVTSSTTTAAPPTTTTRPAPSLHRLVSANSNTCLSGTGGSGTAIVIWTCDASEPLMNWDIRSDGTMRANGLCLSAGYSNSYGLQVRLATCDGSQTQRYIRYSSGEIRNVATGKCVDVRHERTYDGAPVILWSCNGQANQRWYLV